MIAFEAVPPQDERHVGQGVHVPGHAARAGLSQLGEERVARVEASLYGGIELSSTKQSAGLIGVGHEARDGGGTELSSPKHV